MKVTPFICSTFLSDGGVMFGMVPKPLWSRLIEPDDQNRIPQHCNNLLIELNNGQKGIIDTGCGDPQAYPDKIRSFQGLGDRWQLKEALEGFGLSGNDIDFILFTHLHWDHASGLNDSSAQPLFPNATLYIHALEWENATENALLHSAYPLTCTEALKKYTALELFEGDSGSLLPGVDFQRSSGHTEGHCTFTLYDETIELLHQDASELGSINRVIFCGDACPTQHHLKEKYYPSYDLYPLCSRSWKRETLPHAAKENTVLIFSHDPSIHGGTIKACERSEFIIDQALTK